MFREVRRKDREISRREAEKILQKGAVGILCTVDENGQPYGVPLNYVYNDSKIYFHCAVEGHKLDNIRANNKVCFVVYDENEVIPDKFTIQYSSVVVYGKAEIVGESEKIEALKMIINKYSKDYIEEGNTYIEKAKGRTEAVKITVEHITGKRRLPQG